MPRCIAQLGLNINLRLHSTIQRLNACFLVLFLVVFTQPALSQSVKSTTFPSFRHVDPVQLPLPGSAAGKLILLADADFAPWSFVAGDGGLRGISVELALGACTEAGLICEVQSLPFAELLPKLRKGEAQAIVTGLKRDDKLAAEFALTRPYFQSLARFAVRTGSPLTAPDIRTMAGRKLGFRKDSSHARFLEKFYNRSALTPFDSQEDMLNALRDGTVDAVFADAVQLSYWMGGSASKGCCSFLGKAFLDRKSFSRGLGFVVRRDDPLLRQRFDEALDRLETKGVTAEIFARYLPASVW
jgi:polar amino acid transport system substrate-binding protein